MSFGFTTLGLGSGGGAGAEGKLIKWWSNQAMARLPMSSADILITGHFHHLRV